MSVGRHLELDFKECFKWSMFKTNKPLFEKLM